MKEIKGNLEKLDYAIKKTLERHPSWNPEDILLSLIYEEDPTKFITSKANARDVISTITREDIIREIAKHALKVAMADNKYGHLSGKKDCSRFLDYLISNKIPGDKIIEYLQLNPNVLEEISSSFAKIRYKNRKNIDIKGLDSSTSWYIREYLYQLDDTIGILSKIKVTGLKVYEETVNKCRDDICRGVQLKKNSVDYSLGRTMFASSNIGNTRDNQEDSVLLLRHPKNKHFKMLVVADGVGGYEGGGEASRYATQSILYWFESLSEKYYDDIDALSKILERELKKINEQIFAFGDGRETTFVGAIVGKDKTLIASVGDSRAYITKDNELTQISRDDSVVQKYYESGQILTKDDMRFHFAANRVTQCLGISPTYVEVKPNMYFLDNDDYDNLILVSDGVSDCLSDSQIMAITVETPRELIAKALVEGALKNTSKRTNNYRKNEFKSTINAGKDNTTAAVYIKTKKS